MYESERILLADRVPREMLLLLVEIVEAGVPFDVAERALEMARKPERLREALDLCLDAIPDLDAALLASAEATVARCEAATRERRYEMAERKDQPEQESAVARDPFPLLEEAHDPRDLPTVEGWLRAGAPMLDSTDAYETPRPSRAAPSGDASKVADVSETRRIEWPPRSGAVAEYALDEERFLRDLISCCERGEIDQAQLAREVGILHDLKVVLDARMLPDEGADDYEYAPFDLPPPDSPFQIPGRAVDLLAAHDPQLRIVA